MASGSAINKTECQASTATAHSLKEARRATVQIIHRYDVTTAIEQLQDRADRRHSGSECKYVATGLKVRDATLESLSGRVLCV